LGFEFADAEEKLYIVWNGAGVMDALNISYFIPPLKECDRNDGERSSLKYSFLPISVNKVRHLS
jgi:hypothetical protein